MIRKRSRKRDAIYNVIKSTRSHPSAEWIYEAVKPAFPDLSLGTVYRNITMFRNDGEIMCVGSVNGQERFDGNTDPHAHFICKRCGKVDDLMDAPGVVYPEVTGKVDTYQLNFYGLCGECSGKEQAQRA